MALPPQHAYYCAISTRGRIKKSPRWDDNEGVAATVGTIMALLVFLSAMGIFTNQFVPVWMSDNESSHMSEAIAQFANLKSQIDNAIALNPNSHIAIAPVFVPVTLSAEGIPVFAGPTAGILQFTPEARLFKPTLNVTYSFVSTTSNTTNYYTLSPANDGFSGGFLDLFCPNRYYVEQHLAYEFGAVILNQSDGEYIIQGPQFSVKNYGTGFSPSRSVMMTQLSLQGLNKTIGGTGSKGVTAVLDYASTIDYTNSTAKDLGGGVMATGSNLTISIVSKHGVAWKTYFDTILNTSATLEVGGPGYETSIVGYHFPDKTLDYYVVTVIINYVQTFDHTHAIVTMSIGELGV